jgi:hypothetical protein
VTIGSFQPADEMRLDRLELPVRLVNALMNMGLKAVGDVRKDVKLRSAPGDWSRQLPAPA